MTTTTEEQKKDIVIDNNNQEKELEDMFKAGVHFGYSRSKRHPKMAQYLFGIRNNVEIFDLEEIKDKLDSALDFVRTLGKAKKTILFVGTKPAIREIIEKTALEIGMPYVKERWLGGTITNFSMIRKRLDYFEDIGQQQSSGELSKYTKKERLDISKKLERLRHNFGGIVKLKGKPDAVFIIDPKEEDIAVKEADCANIPTIAIMNSDSNPENIKHPIPANDDSYSSVSHLLSLVSKAYQDGMADYSESEGKNESEDKKQNTEDKK